MKKGSVVITIIVSGVLSLGLGAQSPQKPDWHPKVRATWENFPEWKLISPGDQKLDTDKLHNLRVVYIRETDLHTDDPKKVSSSYQFHETVWNGKPAFFVLWTGLGDTERLNKGAHIISTINEAGSYRVLLHMGGAEQSQVVQRFGGDRVVSSQIDSEGVVDTKTLDQAGPAFDLVDRGFVLALMKLKEGMQFRLATYGHGRDSIRGTPNWVAGRIKIRDAAGREHEVWDVQAPGSYDGWINHYYVSHKAPFFLGYYSANVVTGEVSTRVRMTHVERLH